MRLKELARGPGHAQAVAVVEVQQRVQAGVAEGHLGRVHDDRGVSDGRARRRGSRQGYGVGVEGAVDDHDPHPLPLVPDRPAIAGIDTVTSHLPLRRGAVLAALPRAERTAIPHPAMSAAKRLRAPARRHEVSGRRTGTRVKSVPGRARWGRLPGFNGLHQCRSAWRPPVTVGTTARSPRCKGTHPVTSRAVPPSPLTRPGRSSCRESRPPAGPWGAANGRSRLSGRRRPARGGDAGLNPPGRLDSGYRAVAERLIRDRGAGRRASV